MFEFTRIIPRLDVLLGFSSVCCLPGSSPGRWSHILKPWIQTMENIFIGFSQMLGVNILGPSQFSLKSCYFLVRNQGTNRDQLMPGSCLASSHPMGRRPTAGLGVGFQRSLPGQALRVHSSLPALRILRAQLLPGYRFLLLTPMSSDKSSFAGWASISGLLSPPRS